MPPLIMKKKEHMYIERDCFKIILTWKFDMAENLKALPRPICSSHKHNVQVTGQSRCGGSDGMQSHGMGKHNRC